MEKIKEIDTEIFEFITRYENMLLENCPDKIIGIYLFGSLAYGGFDKSRSDIDIVVITKTLLKGLELEAIKRMHKKLENINQKWSKRFEASYTPLDMLKENNPPKDPRPYYGEIFYDEATYGNEWLINNYLLWNYGIAIYGPEFKTLINKPISIEEVRESCIKDFYKEWKPKINDNEWLSNSHCQSYIVLNICRILYTVNKMELANKQKSCEWVKNNYSGWENLIEEAEGWNYDKIMDRKEEVNNFIKFADEIIEEWNDKSKKIESKSNCA